MSLEADVERVAAATVVVELTGRMTLGMRLREIESKITRDVDESTHKLVLDLSGVDYADSFGLGFLMYERLFARRFSPNERKVPPFQGKYMSICVALL
jgi:anti-anti-sigma factor